jgi:hypothetical protein
MSLAILTRRFNRRINCAQSVMISDPRLVTVSSTLKRSAALKWHHRAQRSRS